MFAIPAAAAPILTQDEAEFATATAGVTSSATDAAHATEIGFNMPDEIQRRLFSQTSACSQIALAP